MFKLLNYNQNLEHFTFWLKRIDYGHYLISVTFWIVELFFFCGVQGSNHEPCRSLPTELRSREQHNIIFSKIHLLFSLLYTFWIYFIFLCWYLLVFFYKIYLYNLFFPFKKYIFIFYIFKYMKRTKYLIV